MPKKKLTPQQKDQIKDLINMTILPAIDEDLDITDDTTRQLAINYLLEQLQLHA